MKKIFTVIIFILTLTACNERQRTMSIVRNFQKESEVNRQTDNAFDKVYEFTYKNHDYIKFNEIQGGYSGVVHNPECRYCKTHYNHGN